MKEFSVSMAIVDFIPVILFAIASVIMQRDFYYKMSKGAFALFSAGTIDILCRGSMKALYKMLYAMGICDFAKLNDIFFPMQSLGFLLAGIGMIAMTYFPQKKKTKLASVAVAPALYSGTFIFVICMCLGLGMMDIGLTERAKKTGTKKAIPFIWVSFICELGMGYLSTRNTVKSSVNWIAEIVNITGIALMLIAVLMIHKSLKNSEPVEE